MAIFTDLGVEENLFAVVFGESVLNDAVAVVLYRAFAGMGETFAVHDLAHKSSQTEWWYFNAHLTTTAGRDLSLFCCFFRVATGKESHAHALNWAIVDPVGDGKGGDGEMMMKGEGKKGDGKGKGKGDDGHDHSHDHVHGPDCSHDHAHAHGHETKTAPEPAMSSEETT